MRRPRSASSGPATPHPPVPRKKAGVRGPGVLSLMASSWKVWPGRRVAGGHLGRWWCELCDFFGACRKDRALPIRSLGRSRGGARFVLPEYTDEVSHAYLPDACHLLYGYRVYGAYVVTRHFFASKLLPWTRPVQAGGAPLTVRSGRAHRLRLAGDLARRREHVSGFGRGEGLRGDRAFYAAPARRNKRQHAGGLGVLLRPGAEREVERDELAARLLAQPRNGGAPSSGFVNPPLMYSRVKRPCVTNNGMTNLPFFERSRRSRLSRRKSSTRGPGSHDGSMGVEDRLI